MDRMVYINKKDEERVTEYEGFSTIKNNFKEIFDGIINVEKNNTNNENFQAFYNVIRIDSYCFIVNISRHSKF